MYEFVLTWTMTGQDYWWPAKDRTMQLVVVAASVDAIIRVHYFCCTSPGTSRADIFVDSAMRWATSHARRYTIESRVRFDSLAECKRNVNEWCELIGGEKIVRIIGLNLVWSTHHDKKKERNEICFVTMLELDHKGMNSFLLVST